jgi:hypothetical protein
MTTWRILSNYRAFGLAYAVKLEAASLRKSLRVRANVARRIALIQVRTALVQSINKGEFHG